MRPINLIVPWLPGWIDAITLWPFIVYRRGCEASIPLQRHEYCHWRQAVQWGVVPWYLAYVILLPFYWKRPREHPMEVGAYAVQRATYRQLDRTRRRDK